MKTTKSQTLQRLRACGWFGQDVERYLRGRRFDFSGIGDVIAWHPKEVGVVLIQTTTAGHLAEHRHKVQANVDSLIAWLGRGRTFELWAWGKRSKVRGLVLTSEQATVRRQIVEWKRKTVVREL